MTRSEHIRWAKQRAREYLTQNDPQQAVMSMLSDLGKHEETRPGVSIQALGMGSMRSVSAARQFIEGFSE